MKLSILICHLNDRKKEIEALTHILSPQCKEKPVEILIDDDDGEKTIGTKRNDLLARANGEYVAFIDDDDLVAETYIDDILKAIDESNPDCIGIEGIININGQNCLFKHSIQFQSWYTGSDGIYYRTPNHLNPVKREYAIEVGFPPMLSYGEDQYYSKNIGRHLKTEENVEHPIYFYSGASMGYIKQDWIRERAQL